MYFESSKKTYYRFPSMTSIHELDSRYYFPEKPSHTESDVRYEGAFTSQTSKQDSFGDH